MPKLPFLEPLVANFERPLPPLVGAHLLGVGTGAEESREPATMIGSGTRDFHSARHVDENKASTTIFRSRLNRTLEQIADFPDLLVLPRLDGQDQFLPGASLPRGVKLEREYFDWLFSGYIDGLFRIKSAATSTHAPHGLYTTHAVLELKRDPRDLVAATVQGVAYLLSDTILNEMLAGRKDGRGEPYATLLAIAGPDFLALMFSLGDLLRLREAMDTGVPCTPRVQALVLTGSGVKTVANPFLPTLKLNQPGGLVLSANLLKRIWERWIGTPDSERLAAAAGAEETGLNHVAVATLDMDAMVQHGTQACLA
ncbi:hypothetical protein GGF32_000756 [Allomyces javanicus]|nr:hypothetical protein GGF32_000756 [Allomyces javanicus]